MTTYHNSNNKNWVETILIAGTAAAMGSWMMIQWSKTNSSTSSSVNDKDLLVATAAASSSSSVSILLQLLNNGMNNNNNNSNFNNKDIGSDTAPDEDTRRTSQHLHSKNDGGWSMAEAMEAAKLEGEVKAAMTPAQVPRSLQKGNSRFWSGQASRPEKSAFERRALISQQFPTTAVLGCADSRVPVEIVFDQGLGDMFVVRVAGNCLGPTTEGSLEYAVHKLNVKVLLVMGHEGCGAIKAAALPLEEINQEPKPLATLLKDIKSGLDGEHICQIIDSRARDREAVVTNVTNQVKKLSRDPKIMAKVNDGKLKIVGAFYEISSGIVDFFMQVAKHHGGEEFKPSPGVQSRYNPETKEIVYNLDRKDSLIDSNNNNSIHLRM